MFLQVNRSQGYHQSHLLTKQGFREQNRLGMTAVAERRYFYFITKHRTTETDCLNNQTALDKFRIILFIVC